MKKTGFDNAKYIKMQSEQIKKRISQFGGKLYLEFGGKLFDDTHAARVLPGFEPDSKLKMLLELKDQAEIVIAVSAGALESSKRRGDLGITYDMEVLRLIDMFRSVGLYVGSVVITQYNGQQAADKLKTQLEAHDVKVFKHYIIDGYPFNVQHIVSAEGYGKNDYIETEWWILSEMYKKAVKWRHASLSSIMSMSAESTRAMRNLKRFRYGICRSSIL